ncbi:MAG: ATP-binding cassette domain-containing protein [Elusimicrobia bacterium]|nr:ATP-binding cassette domain-containing protein [Elusimicrobiota bacterium]
MIEVQNLRKCYGPVWAVDGVSFSIEKGEIAGFLGPNGAGKTTTFRMMAGFLPANSGSIKLMGCDSVKNPMDIRRLIGYLPENNPLYEQLEVSEYFSFLWQARGLGSTADCRRRLKEVLPACGLGGVIGQEIGELSKGYRQRVGLGAAILHDPAILLLDEPTSGLDPIQAKEVRQLITSLKKEKTILLSTHILTEVQAICDRVLIIHHGRLVADKPLAELSASEEYVISVSFERALANGESALAKLDGVVSLEGPGGGGPYPESETLYRVRATKDIRRQIFEFAAAKKLPLVELKAEKKSLEEIFHELAQ